MALSSCALTTLETVKADLGITDTSLDTFLERQINGVSEKIAKFCNRIFQFQEKTVKLIPPGGLDLVLPDYPLIAVSEVKVNDQAITDYESYLDIGQLWREDGWEPDTVLLGLGQDPVKTAKRLVEVTYTTGYILPKDATAENPRTLPYELEGYCIEAIKSEYYKKDVDPNVEAESLQSYDVKYDKKVSSQMGLPLTVINGLQQSGWVKYS